MASLSNDLYGVNCGCVVDSLNKNCCNMNMVKLYMVWILSRHRTEKNKENQQIIPKHPKKTDEKGYWYND